MPVNAERRMAFRRMVLLHPARVCLARSTVLKIGGPVFRLRKARRVIGNSKGYLV
jgi:hypothetical protein